MQNSRATTISASFPLDYSTISFLVVDDQPYTRRIVRSILAGFGSREIYESVNGSEALELARNVMPSIIITDLVMPDSSGMTLITKLKAPESPVRKVPIIVLSGYLTKTAALSITSSGADEVLVKPVSPKALHAHISRVILRRDKAATTPAAVAQNQRRRSESNRKKSKELAYL